MSNQSNEDKNLFTVDRGQIGPDEKEFEEFYMSQGEFTSLFAATLIESYRPVDKIGVYLTCPYLLQAVEGFAEASEKHFKFSDSTVGDCQLKLLTHTEVKKWAHDYIENNVIMKQMAVPNEEFEWLDLCGFTLDFIVKIRKMTGTYKQEAFIVKKEEKCK